MFALSAENCGDAPEDVSFCGSLAWLTDWFTFSWIWPMKGTRRGLWRQNFGYIPVVSPKAIVKTLGTMISIYTNSAIRLSGLFDGSRGFLVFTRYDNLMLSFWLLSIFRLLLMPLCEQNLRKEPQEGVIPISHY